MVAFNPFEEVRTVTLTSLCRRHRDALASDAMRFQEFQKLIHPLTGFCGEGKNRHAGADGLDIFVCGRGVELDRFGQVELGDYGDVRAIEDGGILERFVLALKSSGRRARQPTTSSN